MAKSPPRQADFFVIYNRALDPKAETDDTRLSSRFTVDLVEFLERKGHKGHYADRDARLGTNMFTELSKNIEETRKTFVVVTPEFLRNCWSRYCSQSAFKKLIDANKQDKLISIGIDVANEKLEELNISECIHFTREWDPPSSTQDTNKWNKISRVFDDQENVHTQESGDNRLRTDNQMLVVQPTLLLDERKAFLTDKLLLEIGEKFPKDWKILAINLGLEHHIVDKAEQDNLGKVHLQAYNALLSWRNSSSGPEQKKVDHLLATLLEMGRKDLAEKTEADFKEFKQQQERQVQQQQQQNTPRPSTNEGYDEVDMGMSRNRNRVHPLNLDKQSSKKHQAWSESVSDQIHQTGGGEPVHTSYVARELEAKKPAFIEARLEPLPELTTASADTAQLQQGPSVSLPPAPIVKLPSTPLQSNASNQNAITPSQHASSMSERPVDMDQLKSEDSVAHSSRNVIGDDNGAYPTQTSETGGPDALSFVPNTDEIIYSRQAKLTAQPMKPEDEQTDVGGNGNTENLSKEPLNLETKVKQFERQSLSKDEDLTADVDGSFSFNQQVPIETSYSAKGRNLDLGQKEQKDFSLNLNSLKSGDGSLDSGCFPESVTPVSEQITPNENKMVQTAQKYVNQSERYDRYQSDECQAMAENQTTGISNDAISEKTKSGKSENDVKDQTVGAAEERSAQNNVQEQIHTNTLRTDNLNNSCNNEDQDETSPSNLPTARAELDDSLTLRQGQPQGSLSLGTRLIHSLVGMWWRPELAYN